MPRQISPAARMNHQNCVGSISAKIIIIPLTIAIVANRENGPLCKKPPPAQAFVKHYAGDGYIMFHLFSQNLFWALRS